MVLTRQILHSWIKLNQQVIDEGINTTGTAKQLGQLIFLRFVKPLKPWSHLIINGM